jgi:hypothetical protein
VIEAGVEENYSSALLLDVPNYDAVKSCSGNPCFGQSLVAFEGQTTV